MRELENAIEQINIFRTAAAPLPTMNGKKSVDELLKSKNISKLVKKQKTDKRGRQTTVYVRPDQVLEHKGKNKSQSPKDMDHEKELASMPKHIQKAAEAMKHIARLNREYVNHKSSINDLYKDDVKEGMQHGHKDFAGRPLSEGHFIQSAQQMDALAAERGKSNTLSKERVQEIHDTLAAKKKLNASEKFQFETAQKVLRDYDGYAKIENSKHEKSIKRHAQRTESEKKSKETMAEIEKHRQTIRDAQHHRGVYYKKDEKGGRLHGNIDYAHPHMEFLKRHAEKTYGDNTPRV